VLICARLTSKAFVLWASLDVEEADDDGDEGGDDDDADDAELPLSDQLH
jgi:hypothetical protein